MGASVGDVPVGGGGTVVVGAVIFVFPVCEVVMQEGSVGGWCSCWSQRHLCCRCSC